MVQRLATSFVNPKAKLAERFGIKIRSSSSGAELRTLLGHTKRIECLAFSPDGERLISGDVLGDTAKVWNVGTGKELLALRFKDIALRDGALLQSRWRMGRHRDQGEGQRLGCGHGQQEI